MAEIQILYPWHDTYISNIGHTMSEFTRLVLVLRLS